MAGAGTPGREGTPMLTVVPDVAGALPAEGQPSSLIDQIVRDGARQMLAAALQAEVAAYVGQFAVCVPGTSSTSCNQAIFVDHPIDASVSSDAVSLKIDRFG